MCSLSCRLNCLNTRRPTWLIRTPPILERIPDTGDRYFSSKDPAVIAAKAQAAKVAAESAPHRGRAWILYSISFLIVATAVTGGYIIFKRFATDPGPVAASSAPAIPKPADPVPVGKTELPSQNPIAAPVAAPSQVMLHFAAGTPDFQRALICLDATMNLIEGQDGPMTGAKQESIALAIVKVADAAKGVAMAPGDQLMVTDAAAKAGLAPSGGSLAECMGAAKYVAQHGQSVTTTTTPPTQALADPTPKPPTEPPVTGDGKPKLALTPGALARIFVLTDGIFPPKSWPDDPVATLTLPAIPDVKAQWVVEDGRDVPNRLVQHTLLSDAFFYAVEFEAFVRVGTTGPTVFQLTSDDPVTLSIDDQPIVRSDFAINPAAWVVADTMGKFAWRPQMQKTATSVGTITLQAGRAYKLTARAVQRWRPDAFVGREQYRNDGVRWLNNEQSKLAQSLTPVTCGATFILRMTSPGAAEAAPIDAYIVKRERTKREE